MRVAGVPGNLHRRFYIHNVLLHLFQGTRKMIIAIFPISDRSGPTPLITCMPARLHLDSASSGHLTGSLEILYVRSLFDLPLNGRRPKTSS